MHVGQAEVAALEFVSQSFVVNAEQVQQRRLKVVDVDGIFGGVVGEVVRLAERKTALHAAAESRLAFQADRFCHHRVGLESQPTRKQRDGLGRALSCR